jgi:ketosteroid isomerase-like protein
MGISIPIECRTAIAAVTLMMLSSYSASGPAKDAPGLSAEDEVRNTELAFAKSMSDRDFGAFATHLSADAVFFNGSQVLRGSPAVSAAWKPRFHAPKAPFSWKPDHVEVLPSGGLALSTGPVIAEGKVVGRFNSIWRLEAPHTWRIVFDKGESVCAESASGNHGHRQP